MTNTKRFLLGWMTAMMLTPALSAGANVLDLDPVPTEEEMAGDSRPAEPASEVQPSPTPEPEEFIDRPAPAPKKTLGNTKKLKKRVRR